MDFFGNILAWGRPLAGSYSRSLLLSESSCGGWIVKLCMRTLVTYLHTFLIANAVVDVADVEFPRCYLAHDGRRTL